MEPREQLSARRDEVRNAIETRARDAADKASGYVDSATTSVGRGMEHAAESISSRVGSASDGLTRAGRYLQQTTPRAMGDDITGWVREHPTVSLGLGFGVGLLIGRALSRPRSG